MYQQDDADGLFMEELFDLLDGNTAVLETLTQGRFKRVPDPSFEAAPVQSAKSDGYNIYYLKAWRADGALVPWRVIYAVHYCVGITKIRILGLMERADEYEPTSDFGRRVLADYDGAGIPRISVC